MTQALEQRPYGSAGEKVTVVGLGGAPLGARSFADGVATVHCALELGINYFDTAPLYSSGQSQAIYGEALAGRSEDYMLATKVGHLARPARFRSPDALRAQLEENLRLLRRDSVDVLQVHESDQHCWWSDDGQRGQVQAGREYDFAGAPVMEVLREARDEGRCRFIGITGNSADHVAQVLRHVEVDTCLYAFCYHLFGHGARKEALPLAREKGVAIILGGILRGAHLPEAHPDLLHAAPEWLTPELRDRFEKLYAVQRDCGLSLVALAIRFLLAEKDMTTMLIGATTPAEIKECVEAALQGPLPSDLHQAVEQIGAP